MAMERQYEPWQMQIRGAVLHSVAKTTYYDHEIARFVCQSQDWHFTVDVEGEDLRRMQVMPLHTPLLLCVTPQARIVQGWPLDRIDSVEVMR